MTVPAFRDPDEVAFLDEVVEMLTATAPESWWEGPTFRSPCGTKHCVLSHIADRMGMAAMDRFESVWSTSYVVGALVNDQRSDRYPQQHPKDRVLAYLAALRDGSEEDVNTSMEHCMTLTETPIERTS